MVVLGLTVVADSSTIQGMGLTAVDVAPAHEAFKDWILRRGWNQRIAAKQLGIHYTYVNKMVLGHFRPGLQVALRIERLTGIPARDWMATEVDNFKPHTARRARKR